MSNRGTKICGYYRSNNKNERSCLAATEVRYNCSPTPYKDKIDSKDRTRKNSRPYKTPLPGRSRESSHERQYKRSHDYRSNSRGRGFREYSRDRREPQKQGMF